jgi:hypothetical protein
MERLASDRVFEATNLELIDELFCRDARLFQYATQRSGCKFNMQGNNASGSLLRSDALQNNVAATLPNLRET